MESGFSHGLSRVTDLVVVATATVPRLTVRPPLVADEKVSLSCLPDLARLKNGVGAFKLTCGGSMGEACWAVARFA